MPKERLFLWPCLEGKFEQLASRRAATNISLSFHYFSINHCPVTCLNCQSVKHDVDKVDGDGISLLKPTKITMCLSVPVSYKFHPLDVQSDSDRNLKKTTFTPANSKCQPLFCRTQKQKHPTGIDRQCHQRNAKFSSGGSSEYT